MGKLPIWSVLNIKTLLLLNVSMSTIYAHRCRKEEGKKEVDKERSTITVFVKHVLGGRQKLDSDQIVHCVVIKIKISECDEMVKCLAKSWNT